MMKTSEMNIRENLLWAIGFLVGLWSAPSAFARPEFAIKHGYNRCTVCHVSPVGGSLRTVDGKLYGIRSFNPIATTKEEWVSGDFRLLYYSPGRNDPDADPGKSGLAWMAGLVGLNLPVSPKRAAVATNLVYVHNLGGFNAGPRDAYVRWRFFPDTETSILPQYLLLGRFHAPFGLLSDEHRVYTRIQTGTTWNDFQGGLLASGQPVEALHYDVAVVNGNQGPTSLAAQREEEWGGYLNLRLGPTFLPIQAGVSGAHHRKVGDAPSPEAVAAYGLISLERLTGGILKVILAAEYSRAWYWNADALRNQPGFLDGSAFEAAVADKTSEAVMAQLSWDIVPLLTIVARYDQLVFDRDYPADAFQRFGVGFRHYFAPTMNIQARYEHALARHESQRETNAKGAIDAVWALYQVGF